MSRVRFGARATVVAAALVVLLAACGASPATSTSPDTASPDLFQALAAPGGAPVQPPTAAVSPVASTRTTTKTTTTAPPPRPVPPRPVPVAHLGPPAPVSEQWKPVGGDEFNAALLDTGKGLRRIKSAGFGCVAGGVQGVVPVAVELVAGDR